MSAEHSLLGHVSGMLKAVSFERTKQPFFIKCVRLQPDLPAVFVQLNGSNEWWMLTAEEVPPHFVMGAMMLPKKADDDHG